MDSPLGSIKGDIGLIILKARGSSNTLLIVEREGSAPGNERNILKWFEAVKGENKIVLKKSNNEESTQDFNQIILCLAFTRPPKWKQSDFKKTLKFCDLLSGMVNKCAIKSGLPLKVVTYEYPYEVRNWESCGQYIGTKLIGDLIKGLLQ